jgi:aldehyde dehydrogenase (NAD+)
VEESKMLLDQRWDYIFFTGGTEVGRIVYQAAAKHLTPVTLELGGKSPCIIDKDIDVNMTAKRIVWGKYVNAGQTCIAPDYLLVHEQVKDKLLAAMKKHIIAFYGENAEASKDYCRIINERHFDRLVGYLKDGNAYTGGKHHRDQKFIEPTILTDVSADSPVMQEEVFGPILPVLTISSLDQAIDFVNDRAKPLALYVFSKSDSKVRNVLESTTSGGACVNDVVMHMANPSLPFGGVGDSGLGAYHSKSSFELFSHQKSVMHRSFIIDAPVKYPPYKLGIGVVKQLMKWTL